jgi:hypothetical protein
VLLAGASGGAAAEDVFTVANYPVEGRAENAVAAKDRALVDGQQAAFRSLLKRLVSVTAYSRLARLKDFKAGDLVEGVRVRSERNSTTEYFANLDFSFQAKGVRDLLRREGLAFTDTPAPVMTLIPAWREGTAGAPAKAEARWADAWKSLDLEHALAPVRIEALKKEIGTASLNALVSGDGSAMRALVANYASELIVIALAERDASAKHLTVTLAGRDAVGAFSLRRTYRIDASDPGYTSDVAAVVSLGILEGRWKAIKVGDQTGTGAELLIAVEFRGMSEWQDISRRLGATPGVEELEVAGLSARGARITLRFPDGPERLAELLARQGLALRNAGGNWTLSLQ